MDLPTRTFTDQPAVRERVPLLIGLAGPSGGGKTFSALRLATGIQTVTGGDIYGIDTEARRMLHYADQFKFRHVPFAEPFGSLDYLAALRQCVKKGAKILIVDSMSHEHEGVGGCLDFQERELDRLAGSDDKKRERVKLLAWQKPKAARRQLLNGLLQLEACAFIFCFRAKERTKPIRTPIMGRMDPADPTSPVGPAAYKTEVVSMGFTAIAGDEFVYEMTLNCLLLPNAGGVPTWQSENMGEQALIKLPAQFRALFANHPGPLSEDTGQALAQWAAGGTTPTTKPQPTRGPSVYVAEAEAALASLTTATELGGWWNSPEQKARRTALLKTGELTGLEFEALRDRVAVRVGELKAQPVREPGDEA